MRRENTLKKLLKTGKSCIGTWSVIPSASTANIMAIAGFDFVIIDMEHGPASFETAEDMVRALEGGSCAPLIRLPSNESSAILRALEIGAHGVVVPQIETPEQAKNVILAAKYAPIGSRGMSVFTRSSGYYAVGQKGRTDNENKETMVILLVEGVKGIKNLEAIADVGNIDVIYIGTYDLSQSLGIPDQVDSPRIIKEVESCVKKIKNKGIAAGILAQSASDIKQWSDIGIQFISYMVDCGIFHQACSNIVNQFKNQNGAKK